MNKYIVLGLVVAASLAITTSAFAATYAAKFPRADIFAVVEVSPKDHKPVHKFVDGAATCYVYGASISCVK